ncbi:MAG: hypothetical protein QN174_13365 [Armatimonadota bacterium]|nr:hypothetical protein [Armatimonadota bacterium]
MIRRFARQAEDGQPALVRLPVDRFDASTRGYYVRYKGAVVGPLYSEAGIRQERDVLVEIVGGQLRRVVP